MPPARDAERERTRIVLIAAAIATIRARAARAAQAVGARCEQLPAPPPALGQAGASGDGGFSHALGGGVGLSGAITASLSRRQLPPLCDVEESALASCMESLRTEADWPLHVAQRIEHAVREDGRMRHARSLQLSSLALAAVHLLTSGGSAQLYCEPSFGLSSPRGFAARTACQAIIEAFGEHAQVAPIVLDACVEAAAVLVEALEHDFAQGRALVFDGERARARLAMAHVFEAMEGLLVALRTAGLGPLAKLEATRKLVALEQALRDSQLPIGDYCPLVAQSVTQCARVALADDEAGAIGSHAQPAHNVSGACACDAS
ncbi:hypothetical protein KFE25_001008 [Diacronema lutheri]|uniref:Uncharacterized protein n=1 Tax=Diacronema lutheri TaxID=2081491 RepID=A0A8J6C2C9_DIALT|nr:hypothetical protein KFE25_001008 [Diacronema lutheri]